MENYKKQSLLLNRLFRVSAKIASEMYLLKEAREEKSKRYRILTIQYNSIKTRVIYVSSRLRNIDKSASRFTGSNK